MSAVLNQNVPVWPGHKGDGEVAYALGCAAAPGDRQEAMDTLHDALIASAVRRAGPVVWLWWPGWEGLRVCEQAGMVVGDAAREFLRAHPAAELVIAMARTDAR